MIPVKIQCQCGQRYAFDIEPEGGQMPFAVACPGCGVDGTAAANEIIAQRLASPPPPPPTGLSVAKPPARPASLAPATLPATRLTPVAAATFTPLTKLAWHQQLWIGLPIGLVAVGGMIGGALGGGAYALNRRVFQNTRNPVLRYVWTGLISLCAVAVYFVIVIFILSLRKRS